MRLGYMAVFTLLFPVLGSSADGSALLALTQ